MWITHLKDSRREQAAEQLWNRYLGQLLQVARRKLAGAPRAVADEEDVVLTAFAALLQGIRTDRFTQLHDRNDLWQVLITLTERKAINQRRVHTALKRGGSESPTPLHTDLEAPEPSPELAAELAEEFARRLEELPDTLEREVAIKRLQGYTNTEIAELLGVGLRTIERKVGLIRRSWQRHMAGGEAAEPSA